MPGPDTQREFVQVARDAERPLPDARRGASPGAPRGNKILSNTAAIQLTLFVGDEKSHF